MVLGVVVRKTRIFVWLTVLILSSGCGKNQPAPWPAAIKFTGITENEKESIKKTLDTFSQTLGSEAFYFDDRPTQFQITITKAVPTSESSNRAGLATYNDKTCLVELSSLVFTDSYENYLEPVLWHELGHCSGMNHDPNVGEIMYRLASTLDYYSQNSIQRFMESFKSLTSLKGKI